MASENMVAVVIPLYTTDINSAERHSFKQTLQVFGQRHIYLAIPEGIDVSELLREHSRLRIAEFPRQCFDGIRGYNRLMTTTPFYEKFSGYDYVLITQLDAFVFSDMLDYWCAKGYDYVGAPWLQRPLNKFFLIDWMNKLKDRRRISKGMYPKIPLYNRVGNGGLSLRKTSSHLDFVAHNVEKLEKLNAIGRKGWPEDVIWSTMPESFKYPTAQEALSFSFDKYPGLCFRRNRNRLPMGCHGWTSRKMKDFWKKYIVFT